MAAMGILSNSEIIKSFVEFIVIYFPKDKVHKILKAFKTQKAIPEEYYMKQSDFLKTRESTSKYHFRDWVQNSIILKQVITLAYEIIQEKDLS